MKLHRQGHGLFAAVVLAVVSVLSGFVRAEGEVKLPLKIPRLDRLEATIEADGGSVDVDLNLAFDDRGRLVRGGVCTVGRDPVSVRGRVVLRDGVVGYRITLNGSAAGRKVTARLRGVVGDEFGDC